MTKEELRNKLIDIKAINDFDSDDPFVAQYFDRLYEVFDEFGKSEFMNGIWCCVQDLVAVYNEPTIATDILRSSKITIDQMRKMQESSGSFDEQMYRFINSVEQ